MDEMSGRSTAPTQPRAGVSPKRPVLPGWLLGLITFALLLLFDNLLTLKVLGPELLRRTDLTHLRQALTWVVLLLYAGTFFAALVAGAVAAKRGLRRGATRLGNYLAALFACLLVPSGLLAYAILARLPILERPTEINFAIIAAGALIGCLSVESRRRRPGAQSGSEVARRLVPGPGSVLACLTVLLVVASSSLPSNSSQSLAARPVAAKIAIDPFDIDDSKCSQVSFQHASKIDITVFSVSIAPNFAYKEEGFADQHWESTVTSGAQVGLKVILGDKVGASLLKGTSLKAGVSLILSADGLLTRVDTYSVPSEDQAGRKVKDAAITYMGLTVTLPGLGEFAKLVNTPGSALSDFRDRTPEESDLEVGGKLTLSATAGALIAYSIDFDLGGGAGVRFKRDTDLPKADPIQQPTKVELYSKLEGNVKADVAYWLNSIGLGGHGELMLAMAIEPAATSGQLGQPVWIPKEISLEASGMASGSDGVSLSKEQAESISKHLGPDAKRQVEKILGHAPKAVKNLGVSTADSIGTKVVIKSKLDLDKSPEGGLAFGAFFAALQRALAAKATPKDHADLNAKTQALAKVINHDGKFNVQGSLVITAGYRIEAFFGAGLGFGGSYDTGVTKTQLLQAGYRSLDHQWVDSVACLASSNAQWTTQRETMLRAGGAPLGPQNADASSYSGSSQT
jgi:hypothetical protein